MARYSVSVGGCLMACLITELRIGCFNCQPVCPRAITVESGGRFTSCKTVTNQCRKIQPGHVCRLVSVEGALRLISK